MMVPYSIALSCAAKINITKSRENLAAISELNNQLTLLNKRLFSNCSTGVFNYATKQIALLNGIFKNQSTSYINLKY